MYSTSKTKPWKLCSNSLRGEKHSEKLRELLYVTITERNQQQSADESKLNELK